MRLWKILVLSFVLLLCTAYNTVGANTVMIVDSAGRSIELTEPLERVVVLNPPAAEILRVLGKTEGVIAVSGSLANNPIQWPEFVDTPVVASSAMREPYYESVVSLRPQAVITYGTHPVVDVTAMAEALAPAGIIVIGVDGYKFETLLDDVLLMGQLFEAEQEASRLYQFFEEALSSVDDVVLEIPLAQRKTVYAETHGGAYHAFGAGSEWNWMLERAGLRNVFVGIQQTSSEIDPEQLLAKNPDLILKDQPRSGVPMGIGATDNTPAEMFIEEMKSRSGWSMLQAVQSGNIYVISRDLGAGPGKLLAIPYLAKLAYPDKLSDLNPQDLLRRYFEEFQGMEFSGLFIYPEVVYE